MGNVKSLFDKKYVNVINEIMISINNIHKQLSNKILALTVVNSPNLNKINVSQSFSSPISNSKTSDKVVIAKGDSAASDHYWRKKDKHCLTNIVPHITPPILLPNKDTVTGTEKGNVPMHPLISKSASTAKILPELKSASLISIGKLCDDNCQV